MKYMHMYFEAMKATKPTGTLTDLMDYFQHQWLDNATFTTKSLSVFGHPVCTKENVRHQVESVSKGIVI